MCWIISVFKTLAGFVDELTGAYGIAMRAPYRWGCRRIKSSLRGETRKTVAVCRARLATTLKDTENQASDIHKH